MTERFYVKGAKIKKTGVEGWFTVDEVCQLLNNQDKQLDDNEIQIMKLKEALLTCKREFRKYDGRKLFDLEYVIHAGILSKIDEVLDQQ